MLNLPGITGHLVENRTGLTGVYDFALHYSPSDPPPLGFDYTLALHGVGKTLGLKLESVKAPVKVLVIDDAERPSEN